MFNLLTLIKKMLIQGEFDMHQTGISPLLDKRSVVEMIDTWQDFLHTKRVVGEYWSSGQGYHMYQSFIKLAEDLVYNADVDEEDRDGCYIAADYEFFDDVVDGAEEFMNTYFRDEGFFWGTDDIHGGYGYYPMTDRYTLVFAAAPTADAVPVNAKELVLNQIRTMPCVLEVSPMTDEYMMEVEVETTDLAEVRQDISDILSVVGFGRVLFATR